jgi:hypothetical protein
MRVRAAEQKRAGREADYARTTLLRSALENRALFSSAAAKSQRRTERPRKIFRLH